MATRPLASPYCVEIFDLPTLRDSLGLPDPALPASLHALAQWLSEHGEKGEQEGYL